MNNSSDCKSCMKNAFAKTINLIPVTFTNVQIIFFDGEDYVATINETNFNIKFMKIYTYKF